MVGLALSCFLEFSCLDHVFGPVHAVHAVGADESCFVVLFFWLDLCRKYFKRMRGLYRVTEVLCDESEALSAEMWERKARHRETGICTR